MLDMCTFQDAVTTNVIGQTYPVMNYVAALIEVIITGGTATVTPQFSGPVTGSGFIGGAGFTTLPVVRITDGVTLTAITATGLYAVDCSALSHLRFPVSGIAGATVTVRSIFTDEKPGVGSVLSGTLAVDTELPAAVAVPADNTESIAGLSMPLVRAFLDVRDSNGLVSTTTLAGGTANNDGLSAVLYKSLYVIAQQMVLNGTGWDRLRTPSTFKVVAAVAITAATGATIWTPAAGKKFRLMGYSFSASAAASLRFYDGAAGALTTQIFRGPLLAAAGIDNQYNLGNGILSAAANNTLALDVSANATITGSVWGVEE